MAHSHYVLRERKAFLREMEATLELNPGSPYSTTLAVDQGPRLPFIALGTSTQASTWPSSRKQDFRRKDVTFV